MQIKQLATIRGTQNNFTAALDRKLRELDYPEWFPVTPDSVKIGEDDYGKYIDVSFFSSELYTEEKKPEIIEFIRNYPGLLHAFLNGMPEDPDYLEI